MGFLGVPVMLTLIGVSFTVTSVAYLKSTIAVLPVADHLSGQSLSLCVAVEAGDACSSYETLCRSHRVIVLRETVEEMLHFNTILWKIPIPMF